MTNVSDNGNDDMSTKELKPHPHADVLRAIADGRCVEYKPMPKHPLLNVGWVTLCIDELDDINPIGRPGLLWRIKPKTHWINGIECPAPLRTFPKSTSECYIACPTATDWYASTHDIQRHHLELLLERRMLYPTKEAATANAQAMLEFKDNP